MVLQHGGKAKDCEEEKRKSVGLLLAQNASMPQFSDSLQPYLAATAQVSVRETSPWLCLSSPSVSANQRLLRVYLGQEKM